MKWPARRLDMRMFSSQVARRAFVTFIACALVPVCALAVLAFQQVTSQLQEQSQRRLQQTSKQVGMALLNRLMAAEAALGQTGDAKPGTGGDWPASHHGATRDGRRGVGARAGRRDDPSDPHRRPTGKPRRREERAVHPARRGWACAAGREPRGRAGAVPRRGRARPHQSGFLVGFRRRRRGRCEAGGPR